jgi:hypothetical protein
MRAAILLAAISTLLAATWSTSARAMTLPDYVPEVKSVAEGEEAPSYGWKPLLKASANVAFGHNSNVVGSADGSTWTIGSLINGGLGYLAESGHEWANTLSWQLAYNKTPLLEEFVKSLDNFELTSSYLYHIPGIPWFGPFASLMLKTSLFPGYDVRAADTTYRRLYVSGQTEDVSLLAQERLDLTDYFAPTQLRQSAGVFADIFDRKLIKLQTRTGVGAWEIFGRDGFVLADDGATPEVEVKQIEDSVQLGWELNAVAEGTWKEYVTYKLKANLMYPFVHNTDTELEGMDLMNIETELLVGFKLSEWASLDYSLKLAKVPFVSEEWQIQNGLMLTLTANIVE